MNKLLFLTAVATLGLGVSACTTTTQTQTADAMPKSDSTSKSHGERSMRRHNRGGHSKGAFFETYDLDGDGRVLETEFYEARDQGYDARDMDRNGSVVPDEYVAEYEGRLDQQLAEQRDRQLKQAYVRFGVLDGDEDGVMTREEFKQSGKRMFDRLDTNKDGVVDDSDSAERY